MSYESKQVKQFFAAADELLKTSKTMQDIFMMSTSLHKGEKALTWLNEKGKPTSIKYKQYRSMCFEYGSRISELLKGVPTDSVVALKVKNCPEWPLIFWGILMSGYIPFLIDAKLPKDNTEVLLAQSHAAAIISQEIVTYSIQTISVNTLKEAKVNMRFAARWANFVMFCSSGTTGNVKLMVYNGANLCNQIAAALDMPNETNDIMYPGEINIIAIIPFHHIFGFVAVFLWYTFFGKNIVFVKDLSPTEVLGVSQKCGVTHIYSVPLFWDSIAQQVIRKAELEGTRKADLLGKMIAYNTHKISMEQAGQAGTNIALTIVQNQLLGRKVRYCISGGGYLSAETLNTINGIGYHLYNGYGMTEAGVTSVELSDEVEIRLKGSIGRPLHGVEYKLINTSKLEPHTGELLIKSNITHCMEIIDGEKRVPDLSDGYLHTGDIASVDETGRYYLKGRIKDIIINENGENIYPDEIEDYFKGLPGVTKVCVVGVKKGKNQHEAITCVFEISSEVGEEDMLEIKKKCDEINATLSNEKRVQSFLVSKHTLPLTASMKVKRFKVKETLEGSPDSFVKVGESKKVSALTGYKLEDVEPVVKKLRSVFAKILLLPYVRIGDGDHWINDLGGDSMSYIELITTVNKEFEVEIPEEKYALLVCINDFAEEILSLKGIKKS
ncbi:MAG: AMP-binding protein [Bacilli bacterium]|nr:AMP-binding protein [Bacilli bacterium]